MSETDLQNTKDETSHHSLIIRCWRDSLGELRGLLINPVTNRTFVFASTSDMHQALDRAVDEITFAKDDEMKGKETDQK